MSALLRLGWALESVSGLCEFLRFCRGLGFRGLGFRLRGSGVLQFWGLGVQAFWGAGFRVWDLGSGLCRVHGRVSKPLLQTGPGTLRFRGIKKAAGKPNPTRKPPHGGARVAARRPDEETLGLYFGSLDGCE